MFFKKSPNVLLADKKVHALWLIWVLTAVFSPCASAFAARRALLDPCIPAVEPAPATSAELETVQSLCNLICQGRFTAAQELLEKSTADGRANSPYIAELAEILREHQELEKKRQAEKQAAYKEQLAELEKLRNKANDPNPDPNDPNAIDLDDANDVSAVLSVISRAREFADDDQRRQLLNDRFVKKVIRKAIENAAALEARGHWLEAYTDSYYWLEVIDPNNEAYSNHAEELLDKAQIAASFEDSPCETSEERYQGVRKVMFERAVHALSVNYVNLIDYGEMAAKALERCKLLGEVMAHPSSFGRDPNGAPGASNDGPSFAPPDKQQLSAWLAALAAVEDEISKAPTGFNKKEFLEVFDKVLTLNSATAKLPETVLIAHFAEAALAALDPYTVMVWPKQVQDFEKMMTNEFTGIGIEISKRSGLLTVASLLPDTPAYNSGLDAGDIIEKVDGVETKDMTLMCAVHRITGPKGTQVKLTIRRPGEDKTRDIVITRDRIKVPTIRGWQRTETGQWLYMLDEELKIGYVRLTSFSAESPADLENVLLDLESKGLKALILDLRFNTGGLLDSAVAVADKFLESGLIVRTQPGGSGFARWPTVNTAHKSKTHPNYPVVILVNSSSASASEIVAGALADPLHKRAILVGTRTHGKGSVQGITHYPGDGAQLKYTMAYYHLPSGQRVESQDAMKKQGRTDWGVGPNVEVKLRSDELKKMIDTQRENDVLVQAGRNGNGPRTELKKHGLKETLDADPQLATALLVAKSKIVEARANRQLAKAIGD